MIVPVVAYVALVAFLTMMGGTLAAVLMIAGGLLFAYSVAALLISGESKSGIYWPILLASIGSVLAGCALGGVF